MMKYLLRGATQKPAAEPAPRAMDAASDDLARAVNASAHRHLGRSLAIRVVDAGSCNGCEQELNALSNPYYDLARFGLHIVASPRHADVLMVTGPVTHNMREALERSWNAMPAPKWLVTVGDCALDGGCFKGSYAVVEGGVAAVLPVDLHIPGCAPEPEALLSGLLALLEAAQGARPGAGR